MRPWKEIISEARDRNKEKAEQKRRMKIAKTALKGSAALESQKKGKEGKLSPEEIKLRNKELKLKKRFQKTREKGEERKTKYTDWVIAQSEKNKAEQLKKTKERELESHKEKAKQALANIKPERISSRESDASAYTKAIGNVGSLAGGLTKAAIHGVGYLAAKRKAKKEEEVVDSSKKSKLQGKKERKSGIMGGRPPKPPAGGPPAGGPPAGGPPAGGPPAGGPPAGGPPKSPASGVSKTGPVRPSIGTVTGPASNPKRPKKTGPVRPSIGTVTGPASNPKRPYNEEYSNWREEFIIEIDNKKDKESKQKIIDVMSGKNKIEINPNIKEEKDEEGGMARNELATIERAVKSLRKKINSPQQQIPAWVQSKISKAADYIDTVSDYMMGETEPVTEGYDEDDETFRQHSRETFSSSKPSESRKRTANVLKLMKQMNADVEKPKKKKKKKAVTEECGCMDDKKKVLAMAILKKAVDAKKKKNFQLNNEIIGEGTTPAWQRKEGKNPEGGLNAKGRASAKAQGHNLKPPVTTPPSKLDPDSKAAKRRKSFCARMGGMPGPMKDEKGRPTRKALSLRKWNC